MTEEYEEKAPDFQIVTEEGKIMGKELEELASMPSEKEEQRVHREMLERMEKTYIDDSYEIDSIIEEFASGRRKVNRNSTTLVVYCINKLYSIVFNFGQQILNSMVKVNSAAIKKFFIHCSKLYVSHEALYVAM